MPICINECFAGLKSNRQYVVSSKNAKTHSN